MTGVFQIKDHEDKRLSTRQTSIRKNMLKLKYANSEKTFWKLDKQGYLMNIFFNTYMTLKDDVIFLTSNKKTKWKITKGQIHSNGAYLAHSLHPSTLPYRWHINYINYNDNKYLSYIGYGIGGLLLLSLIFYMCYFKVVTPLLLLYIYFIIIIYLLLYIQT